MSEKLIEASQAKVGTPILVDGVACIVKSNDISKTGKHGHAKCRIEAISVIDGKKKVFVVSGHERLERPIIEKRKAQVLSISDNKTSIIDSESFETFEVIMPDELKSEIKEGNEVEYWIVQNEKIIKKRL